MDQVLDVSAVVPCHNEAANLPALVASIRASLAVTEIAYEIKQPAFERVPPLKSWLRLSVALTSSALLAQPSGVDPGDAERQTARGARDEVLGRLALIAGGLVLSLVVLEVLLQLAGACIRVTGHRSALAALTGRYRILTLGDSNTYGLYLERNEAYPQQFGHLWNERHRSYPVEVLNMGYPGNSSSQLLRHLPEMLAATRPDLLTVMIGVNDFWTEPVPVGGGRATLGSILWQYSRIYRLAYMLARSRDGADVEVIAEPAMDDGRARRTVRYGAMEIREVRVPAKTAVNGWQPSLVRNLATIAATAKAAGVDVVFLTYPSPHDVYATADALIRRAAADTGTPLVDVAARFSRFCPRPDCAGLLFKDGHPTARGDTIAARLLVDWLASRPGWRMGETSAPDGAAGSRGPVTQR